MSLLIKDCNIIDAVSPEVRTDQYVLIEDGAITQVGSGSAPSADTTIDLGGTYLLPGLWDVHTHLNKGTWGPEIGEEDEGPAKAVANHGRHAMDALRSGVTSLRVVGIADWADVAWRDAFNSGQFMGPRLFACGNGLNTPAGHMADLESGGIANGPGGFIKAVRNEIMHGVDQIKLVTTGGIMGTGHDVMHHVMFTQQEVEAAIRIATMRGVPVKARNDALRRAVRMFRARVSYWLRWASSVMTMMSSRCESTGCSSPRSVRNFWIRVNTYRWSSPRSWRRCRLFSAWARPSVITPVVVKFL